MRRDISEILHSVFECDLEFVSSFSTSDAAAKNDSVESVSAQRGVARIENIANGAFDCVAKIENAANGDFDFAVFVSAGVVKTLNVVKGGAKTKNTEPYI